MPKDDGVSCYIFTEQKNLKESNIRMAHGMISLCKGKYIGIETIYTVVDGRQINIPEKLKELRAKSSRYDSFALPLLSLHSTTLLRMPMPPNTVHAFEGKMIPAVVSPAPITRLYIAASFNAFFFGLGSVTEIPNVSFSFSQV